MKRIDAVIKPAQLDQVKDRLTALGVTGLMVFEAKGFGRQEGHTEMRRGTEYTVDFLPKAFITILVPDNLVESIVRGITETARTDQIGDGKIFISSLDDVIRIRNGRSLVAATNPSGPTIAAIDTGRVRHLPVRRSPFRYPPSREGATDL